MKIRLLSGLLCAVALALGTTAYGAALDFDDQYDLGYYFPGTPSGQADEVNYVNHLIGMGLNSTDSFAGQDFVRKSASCGTCPAAVFNSKDDSGGNTVDLGSGVFTYLLAKYDAGNAGVEVWNVQGLTGEITIPDSFGKYGLSHWTLFGGGGTTTPDSGTTAALLGLGLTGLAGLRARFGRK